MTDLPSTNIVHTRRPPIPSTESRQSEEVEKESGISAQASDRISGAIGRLVPFFERQAGRIERQPGFDATTKTTDLRRITSAPAVGGSGEADVVEGGVMSIIALVDDQMSKGAPFPPQEFPITAKDYEETPSSSASDLMWRLQADRTALEAGQSKNQPSPEAGAEFSFQEVKEELFLSVYGMLRCFINVKTHKSRLIAKSERQTYPNRHEIKYVVAAKDEIEKLELVCSDLLKGIRPDSGDDDGAIRYNMPTPLIQAFESIVLYLLCIWRASRRYGVESSHLTQVQDQFYEHLREAEAAFIRMRVHAEADDDRFAGFESLRTADTLLALLVENVLDISDSSVVEDRPDAPHFDLRHVYSKYTSECIVKAKRHASARIHKDVKLLIEEIATVGEILEQQRSIVNDLFSIKKRESPMQALDQRVKRRTLAHLDETARHFKKLYEHARQAADWNQHFINVRGEDNNKAIYVFTAVTVIFLPLTFVAGLLGMNTKEIRDTKDSQWLFWAVAMPFTACVLVICIGIVQYKFLVRKRLNAVLRRCCGSRRRR
ncbi:uncharacterized protein HMPREF1541_02680 [Cyphellophora europaea CBS 101466]|uniref:Magnesium transporter n=1 Tax=Cyphellophora europaea (strain CBS 101466) TaxID=1220924 RepID=W2S490_CYPE1|nr:uncharacterized protein HMPREF1541_02680 [Cyphellophora europaea CBS 101466]ETN43521.1 hypothetical protein HMPREF1541_02680 [Cyphellophora europaea CBS 101466]